VTDIKSQYCAHQVPPTDCQNYKQNIKMNRPTCDWQQWMLKRYWLQQELSYRKQIARQLRKQYVEGIHRPKYYTVTLKSRLRVTQGHWKRNHWTDHTRLTVLLVELFDVKYYRDLGHWQRYHLKALVQFPIRLPQ